MPRFQLIYRIIPLCLTLCILSCGSRQREKIATPWGEVFTDSASGSSRPSLNDIINNGELIILTLSGPDTYFDYHKRSMGTQYLLCEKFAQEIGVSLRVETCKDTLDMINRLAAGEGDIIVFMLPKDTGKHDALRFCGPKTEPAGGQWAVAKESQSLARQLDEWYKPGMLSEVEKEVKRLFTTQRVKHRVYAPFLNRGAGVTSKYDNLFRRYAPAARWDWRLLAAQCYQESGFDPGATSWAGACGLMQIMPSTADHLGLPRGEMRDPEKSIEAAVRLIAELNQEFMEIRSLEERQNFILASYNGGANHIKDAMALTRKNGGNCHRWADVSGYVLKLQEPQYYKDPVVRYGYMRGSETVDYVYRIRQRYAQYRGVKFSAPSPESGSYASPNADGLTPHPAKKKHRFHI